MSTPYPSAPKRLERSTTDKFLGGVCGGVARYLNMDPTLVRVLWVILTLVLGGAPLIVYLVMLFVVPEENSVPGYRPPVNGPQPPPFGAPGAPGAAGASGPEQRVWGEAGAPWDQRPAGPTFSSAPTAAPHPESPAATGPDASAPEPNPADAVGDYDSVAGSATKGEHDAADPNESNEPSASPEAAADASTTDAADHNEQSKGQQPTS